MARKYELSKRAERQQATRLRIVEAAVWLHEEVGPARTTISAIAERAGVQRLTVYRHFPDDRAIFQACSQHFNERNPPPDPATWLAIADTVTRLESALRELYRYFESTAPMLAQVIRDAPNVPAMSEAVGRRLHRLEYMTDVLLGVWSSEDPELHRRRSAAIHVAIDFHTWQTLTRNTAVTSDEAASLVAGMVSSIGS